MAELPAEVREKAARAAYDAWVMDSFHIAHSTWCRVVDSVVEVLAEHQDEAGHAEEDDTPFPWELDLKAARLVLREVSKHAEAEADRANTAELDRGEWEKLARSCGTHSEKWMNTAKKLERKLARQRRRRKAAEARELETRVELEFLSVHAGQVTAERDALQARVESLRAALEYYRGFTTNNAVADRAIADDRAAGRTEEDPNGPIQINPEWAAEYARGKNVSSKLKTNVDFDYEEEN